MLNNNLPYGLPGLGIGSAAFAESVLYDKIIGAGSKGPQPFFGAVRLFRYIR
jgi:hypothetical protein